MAERILGVYDATTDKFLHGETGLSGAVSFASWSAIVEILAPVARLRPGESISALRLDERGITICFTTARPRQESGG